MNLKSATFLVAAAGVLLWLFAVTAIVWIVAHFVAKYW